MLSEENLNELRRNLGPSMLVSGINATSTTASTPAQAAASGGGLEDGCRLRRQSRPAVRDFYEQAYRFQPSLPAGSTNIRSILRADKNGADCCVPVELVQSQARLF